MCVERCHRAQVRRLHRVRSVGGWGLVAPVGHERGNSGGPAFDAQGDVVGLATFISTSLEGDQAIQGFNFLIPVNTIQSMAKQIGLVPSENRYVYAQTAQSESPKRAPEHRTQD